jgi:hypothetical protein
MTTKPDRLDEIKSRGWYDQGPDDFAWLAAEVERLRAENELLRAVAETSRTYVFGLVNTGSRYDAVVAALAALDAWMLGRDNSP